MFHSFRPLQNPLGFSGADYVVLAIALLASGLIAGRALLGPYLLKITERTPVAMFALAGLAVLLRLALLPQAPVPIASGADDFSYLLLADTLSQARLANVPHTLPQFFEAVFVLQEPTYASIYPLGQGIALALGKIMFGSYWAGVLLPVAAIPALSYWMLREFVFSKWAFVGGLLSAIQFGALSPWMNSYWGGGVSACAGCLVFGSLPRLKRGRRYAILLGTGLALQLLTRPFETLLLGLCVVAWLVLDSRSRAAHVFLAGIPLAAALALTLTQNKAVTGQWTTLPYMLSRYQYGVPTTFTWQPNPIPHRALTAEQELDYRAQAAVHGPGNESIRTYLERLLSRLTYLRFFWLAPLFAAAIAFVPDLRKRSWMAVAVAIAIFWAGTNSYPYFFPHYVAAISTLLVLVAVRGLERLNRVRFLAPCILLICGVHFLFWYAVHALGGSPLPVTEYETWNYVNPPDPEQRRSLNSELEKMPGQQLVFVRYSPVHRFDEWIHNDAEIDRAKVVWAADLGEGENQKLFHYFPHRTVWLLEPDKVPRRLQPYPKPGLEFRN